MPSESSVYRKIQIVLQVSESVRVQTANELSNEIQGLKLDNFLTRHYDADQDEFVVGISEKSIDRIIDFCQLLELIGEDGRLTTAGRKAVRKTHFEKAIASQIRAFFERKEISLAQINRTILRNLHSDPPILTTIKQLWNAVGMDTQYADFSRMLTILAQCGGALVSQKKVYLRIDER